MYGTMLRTSSHGVTSGVELLQFMDQMSRYLDSNRNGQLNRNESRPLRHHKVDATQRRFRGTAAQMCSRTTSEAAGGVLNLISRSQLAIGRHIEEQI